MTRLRLVTVGLLAISTLGTARTLAAQDATPQRLETRARRSRGGSDDAVTRDRAPNDPRAPAPDEPPYKQAQSRGAVRADAGMLCVDSRSRWYVDLFVNGRYEGTLRPHGDNCLFAGKGVQSVYARAVFEDGTSVKWGPVRANTTAGSVWAIHD